MSKLLVCCKLLYILLVYIIAVAKTTTYSGKATWYDPGPDLTACGQPHTSEDIVVAVASQFWGSVAGLDTNHDPICGKTITVSDADNPTVSVSVVITDKCGSCGSGDLDLSGGAFKKFRDLSVGVFPVNWEFA